MSNLIWSTWLATYNPSPGPQYRSTTVRFEPTDIVATVALTSFTNEGRVEAGGYFLQDCDTWITPLIPPTPGRDHTWGQDTARWIDDATEVQFNLRVQSAAASASGLVHDRSASGGTRRGVTRSTTRGVVDLATGSVVRIHEDITLQGGATLEPDELDAALLETAEVHDAGIFPVSSPEGSHRGAFRFDPASESVIYETRTSRDS